MQKRTARQIREHYEIEKPIADRLRNSTADERKEMYAQAYDELFQRVPHHPLLNVDSEAEGRTRIEKELANLQPFLDETSVFLEVGPGDCAVSLEIAKRVEKVYAIDVSSEITKNLKAPDNFELVISDGSSVPAPKGTVDVAYSNQLMEHLHPDDAVRQLRNIYESLKPGGVYLCSTPNRLSGPHDVSRDFDHVATGLHLKEYTVTELDEIFRASGFVRTKVYLRFMQIRLFLPVFPFKVCEKVIGGFPHSLRRLITFNRAAKFLLGIKLIGEK